MKNVAINADIRATGILKKIVARNWRVPRAQGRMKATWDFIAHRTAGGGAPPES